MKKRTCVPGYSKFHQWAVKAGDIDPTKWWVKANPVGGKKYGKKANVRGH